MTPPSLLIITQDDNEGCVTERHYLGVSDAQAIVHFVNELRDGFLPSIIPDFKEQLTDMLSDLDGPGTLTRHDPSIQGAMTVSRVQVITPESLPKVLCRHCGAPIALRGDSLWVHEDPDEDPTAYDYGWISCSDDNSAEPPLEEEPERRRYHVRVSETRDYTRTYTVEASSPEEAVELAEKGETVEESEGTLTEICNREAISTPEPV